MTFKSSEIRALAILGAGFPILMAGGWWAAGPIVVIPALTLIFVVLLAAVLGGVRRLRGEIEESLRQTQSLLFINDQLQTDHPLPSLGGAALYPDSAALLIGLINKYEPGLILELGSGVSTVVCAQALRKRGQGRIISLDHDEYYAEITRRNLHLQGLEDHAEVRFAPIEPVEIEDEEWQWYATSELPEQQLIDLLIVDGPPKKIQHLARYPALPLLIDRLAPDCRIVLDDTNRKDEREIVRRWQEEISGFHVRELTCGKGAAIFERTAWSIPSARSWVPTFAKAS